MQLRSVGTTDLRVSAVALGCWPIAGMTSPDTNHSDSLATIAAALEVGINFLDTAFGYGASGESERLIGQSIAGRRGEIVLATKGGIHWQGDRERVLDARPERLQRELDESLRRLGTDYVDLLYLHAPDPRTPVAESAGGLKALQDAGKARAIGVSNLTIDEMEQFQADCPIAAVQPPYNMLQRGIEADVVPWAERNKASVMVYWPLLKGLLAGALPRDHVFPEGDSRLKYPMFVGDEFQRNLDFVDELRQIADAMGRTVADLVVNWTIHQPGITAALCGAKRGPQIEETAAAMSWHLDEATSAQIDAAIVRRGPIASKLPV